MPLVQTAEAQDRTIGGSDFVIEPSGAVTYLGYQEPPILRVNRAGAKRASIAADACMLWAGGLGCVALGANGEPHAVALLDLDSGEPKWTVELASLPMLRNLCVKHVVLAALDGGEAVAVLEAVSDEEERQMFLLIVNSAGAVAGMSLIRGSFEHMYSLGSHPHVFGLATGAQREIYGLFGCCPDETCRISCFSSFNRIARILPDGAVAWTAYLSINALELTSSLGLVAGHLDAETGELLSLGARPEGSELVSTASTTTFWGFGSAFARIIGAAPEDGYREKWSWEPDGMFSNLNVAAASHAQSAVMERNTLLVIGYRATRDEWSSGIEVPMVLFGIDVETGASWSCDFADGASYPYFSRPFAVADETMVVKRRGPHPALEVYSVPGILAPRGFLWEGPFGGSSRQRREMPRRSE